MNLLIDIGNQNIKWCCGEKYGIFTAEPSTFLKSVEQNWAQLQNVKCLFVVNVGTSEIFEKIKQYARHQLNASLIEIETSVKCCGIKNGYQNAMELGADRWVALIGARAIHSQSSIVVDCGTAITVDALAADGTFVGGSILPGFHLSKITLCSKTSKIDEFQELKPTIPATSTVHAVSSGIVFGIVGGVELLIKKYLEMVGASSKLLITGGDAELIVEHSSFKYEHVPNLVLRGLLQISENKQMRNYDFEDH